MKIFLSIFIFFLGLSNANASENYKAMIEDVLLANHGTVSGTAVDHQNLQCAISVYLPSESPNPNKDYYLFAMNSKLENGRFYSGSAPFPFAEMWKIDIDKSILDLILDGNSQPLYHITYDPKTLKIIKATMSTPDLSGTCSLR